MAIRDTSTTDTLIEKRPNPHRRLILMGGGVALLIVLALLVPGIKRMLSADASVSASRISMATVERGSSARHRRKRALTRCRSNTYCSTC